MSIPDDMEPSLLCNPCAQLEIERLVSVLQRIAKALAPDGTAPYSFYLLPQQVEVVAKKLKDIEDLCIIWESSKNTDPAWGKGWEEATTLHAQAIHAILFPRKKSNES